jgi:twitching motility protein PilJ
MDTILSPVTTIQEPVVPLFMDEQRLERYQRILRIVLIAMVVILGVVIFFILTQSDRTSRQVGATGQSLLHSQRLAKSVTQALAGVPTSFPELTESSQALSSNLDALKEGSESLNVQPVPSDMQTELQTIMSSVEKTNKSVKVILGQQNFLTGRFFAIH